MFNMQMQNVGKTQKNNNNNRCQYKTHLCNIKYVNHDVFVHQMFDLNCSLMELHDIMIVFDVPSWSLTLILINTHKIHRI